LQIGGSDQWGNITSGVELIRRIANGSAWGLTFPLLTDASGNKFGKSTDGQKCWLDPERTSPHQFYQYWLPTDDADVPRFLKIWTFLSHEEIDELIRQHTENPGARVAHATLAAQVTAFVHGEGAVRSAERASRALFGGSLDELEQPDWEMISGEIPHT